MLAQHPFTSKINLIRTRLTLWIIGILAIGFLLLVLITFLIAHSLLVRLTIERLQQNVTSLSDAFGQENPGTNLTLVHNQLDAFSTSKSYLQYQNLQGRPIASSKNMGKLILPLAQLKSAIQANRVIQDVPFNKSSFMMYGHVVVVKGKVQGYILSAYNITDNNAIDLLLTLQYSGIVIILTLAAISVWLLVRHIMLRPLEHLANAASQIAMTRDHSLRLHIGKRPDEINRLAQNINSMLYSLEDAYQQMQHINDLQRSFLADVSHELRTPLTIMLSSLDLMKKEQGRDPEFQANALENIHSETERMARMVTRLLMLARTDAGASFAREPLLIVDIINEACRQSSPSSRTIQLECQGFEIIEDAVVAGNADYLKQVFLILLENAYKYTLDDGKVTVIAAIQRQQVAISISDTGIGIPSDDLASLFERFYRAKNARTQPGMGLGLSIAKSIIEQHNGTIRVESILTQGSCFTISLPLLNE
ncbi:sensor histidine kinase [Dictyobacter arantiisoli]|uniref:histidine kinase n=1 Tax=Dictyobacter arantiisoli TaxID=2014874 RepID=A0A5A5TE26_9CHLR|nr:HAMP domain-containing sensor histidine kinase [Dictyobacter arantiisoli]GCF09800.1 two-component sensor histidine kinase [Dictyobacter arantiisoli]